MADIELKNSVTPQRTTSNSGLGRANTQNNVSRQQTREFQTSGLPVRREHSLKEEDYLERVIEYANRPIEHTLYPGSNFFKLAEFLKKSGELTPAPADVPTDIFSYGTLYLLHALGSSTSSKSLHSEDFGSIDELPKLDESMRKRSPAATANQLLFLRGFLSPDWLRKLGWYYTVDPEFYRRHLDLSSFSHQQWFSSPSLPSTSNTILQLRISSLARRTPGENDVEKARKEAQGQMAAYLSNVSGREIAGNLGESMVRKINIHDEHYFSVEQDVSITFCKAPKSWTVIAWFDSGKNLTFDRSAGPWSQWNFEIISTIRNEPNTAIHSGSSGRRSQQLLKRAQKFQQSRAVINLDYDRFIDNFENLHDAFYAVSPIFKYKATAENQFLNLVDSVLQQSQDKIRFNKAGIEDIETLRKCHNNFAYHKEILESHLRSIGDNLRALRISGGPQWPRSAPPSDRDMKVSMDPLLEDFEWLEKRAKSLSDLCDRAMKDIHDKSTLTEALRSNDQAAQVNSLNKLATFISVFYLPLSFTCSFFGMNFHTFGQGDLPLWIYPIVSLPVLFISLFFMLPSIRRSMASIWERSGLARPKKKGNGQLSKNYV